MTKKMCCRCKIYKDRALFSRKRSQSDGLALDCKECNAERNYIKKYGITLDDYKDLLDSQDGTCAVCDETPENQRYGVLVVDHNHVTGEVRGLLCGGCNKALGFAGDSITRLESMVQYLEEKGSYGEC